MEKIKLVIEEVENRSIPSVFGAAPNAMNTCTCTCTCCSGDSGSSSAS